MKVYKGTNKDIQCNGYQFEVGKEHEEKTAKLCRKGFHACENPLDVLRYYSPSEESRYFEAELDATDETHNVDTKRVGKKIKLVAEIGLLWIIKAGLQFVFEKVEKIDFSKAEAANSGYRGTAANSGDYGTAANSGDYGMAETTGEHSVALVSGECGKAKGVKGCVLFLIERANDGSIVSHKSLKIDGKKYKEEVLYTLKGGKVVEMDG